MIEREGFSEFFGIPCVFRMEPRGIRLFPTRKDDYSLREQARGKHDFVFSYSLVGDRNCMAYIEDTECSIDISVLLRPRYIVHLFNTLPINGFEMKGDALDDFFAASSVFYVKRATGNYTVQDYIYQSIVDDNWKIYYEDKPVKITLSYGDILSRGVASDLKLRSKLTVQFPETCDMGYVYRLYSIIILFLQIVRYRREPIKCTVKLFSSGGQHNSGHLFDWNAQEENTRYFSQCNYVMWKPFMKDILQFCANNEHLVIRHFPLLNSRFRASDYTPNDMNSLFAAFERECKAEPECFQKADQASIAAVKAEMIIQIEAFKKKENTDAESDFIKTAISNIKRQGTEYGQKTKLIHAFQVMRPVVDISSKRLLLRANIGDSNGFSDRDFEKIANYLNKLRGKTTHENSVNTFTEEDAEYIHFFEIIVYAMLLRRIGVDVKRSQYILGSLFLCNDTLMEFLDLRATGFSQGQTSLRKELSTKTQKGEIDKIRFMTLRQNTQKNIEAVQYWLTRVIDSIRVFAQKRHSK